MKRQRKLIATLIATALLLTCNNSYSVAFAEEQTTDETSIESNIKILNTENENNSTETNVTEKESDINTEDTTTVENDITDDLLYKDPVSNESINEESENNINITDDINKNADNNKEDSNNIIEESVTDATKEENTSIENTNEIKNEEIAESEEIESEIEDLELSFEGFSLPNSVASNGYDFTPTITIKSNKKITSAGGVYKFGDNYVYIESDDISSNGNLYAITFSSYLPTDGFAPLEYLKSGNYSLEELNIVYENEQSDGSTLPYFVSFGNIYSESSMHDYLYDFSGYNIQCENPDQDITPPILKDITLNKNTFSYGDEILVKVSAHDSQSGIPYHAEMFIKWTSEDGLNEIITHLGLDIYDSIDSYISSITIDDSVAPGTYKVSELYLIDRSSNSISYNYENASDILSKAEITVLEKTSDNNNNNNNNNNTNNNANGSSNTGNNNSSNKPLVTKPSSNKPLVTKPSSNHIITTNKIPKTGDPISTGLLGLLSSLSIAGGYILNFKKRKN